MFTKIKEYLHLPYPLLLYDEKGWRYLVGMALFFALGINLLQPFGLTNWHEQHKWLILSVYGLIYAGVYVLNFKVLSHFFPSHYNPDRWTIGKELAQLILFFPETSVLSRLFSTITVIELKIFNVTFLQITFYNLVVGFLTVIFFGLVIEILYYRSGRLTYKTGDRPMQPANLPECEQPGTLLQTTESILPAPDCISFKKYKIKTGKIHHIESRGNNLNIYLREKGQLEVRKFRCPLKELDDQLKDDSRFQRCERSFIVNTDEGILWRPKDHGLELKLRDYAQWIPVSDQFKDKIKEIIQLNSIVKEDKSGKEKK